MRQHVRFDHSVVFATGAHAKACESLIGSAVDPDVFADSWELMMAAYDARRLTEQAFDTEKSTDRRLRTGNAVTLEGRYFIQFIAQILRAEIRATLRENDCDAKYTEEGLMATMSTLNVLEYGDEKGLSEITKNVRRILKLFGVDVPSKPMYHVPIFDMQSYVANSTLTVLE